MGLQLKTTKTVLILVIQTLLQILMRDCKIVYRVVHVITLLRASGLNADLEPSPDYLT